MSIDHLQHAPSLNQSRHLMTLSQNFTIVFGDKSRVHVGSAPLWEETALFQAHGLCFWTGRESITELTGRAQRQNKPKPLIVTKIKPQGGNVVLSDKEPGATVNPQIVCITKPIVAKEPSVLVAEAFDDILQCT